MASSHSLRVNSSLICHSPKEKETLAQSQNFDPATKQENTPEGNPQKQKLKQTHIMETNISIHEICFMVVP